MDSPKYNDSKVPEALLTVGEKYFIPMYASLIRKLII